MSPEIVGSERRRKELRKRSRTHGHGTLNESDLIDAFEVNLGSIDVHADSFEPEFGPVGEVPPIHQWNRKIEKKIKPHQIHDFHFDVKPAKYRLSFFICSRLSPLLSPRKECIGKVWIRDNNKQHTNFSANVLVRNAGNWVHLDFDLSKSLNKSLQLIGQISLQSSLSTARIVIDLSQTRDYCKI